MSLPPSIPRFLDARRLQEDPLSFLRAAHASAGDIAVISEDHAVFSRARHCSGAVGAFGIAALRQILTDTDIFGMPITAGERYSLPPRLVRLNKGLFTMRGEQHHAHQQLLMRVLVGQCTQDYSDAILRGWHAFAKDLRPEEDIHLLSEMRRLVLNVSERVIFGGAEVRVGKLIQSYFDDRRSFVGQKGTAGPTARRELVRKGARLDGMLHAKLAELREKPRPVSPEQACLFARLSGPESNSGQRLTDEELVAHANMLFTSSSEPVAVAITWTLLLLSQHADLRRAVRHEIADAFADQEIPAYFSETRLPLLRGVVLETLRLLPPNAIMVRLTTKPGKLLGHLVPANCEVLLSPYVAHRDGQEYAEPDRFDPWRWRDLHPTPYSYLPFGLGARYCLGKHLASFTLLSVLARILGQYDLVLPFDQTMDWKMDIVLTPIGGPIVRFLPRAASSVVSPGGRLRGPVLELICGSA